MAWKKYFSVVSQDGTLSPVSGNTSSQGNYNDFGKRNYSSYLPEVYTGHPNRVNRYSQYDSMDADSEINAALDIIAEFCTQINTDNQTPFEIKYNDNPTEQEVMVLRKALKQWTSLNKLDKRAFRIFRNCIKYGDVFFVRDPETQELLHIDASKVDKVIVNESEGKRPEQYVVRDLNINLQNLTATEVPNQTMYTGGATGQNQGYQGYQGVGNYATAQTAGGASSTSRFQENMNQYAINAEHVLHSSLSEGIGENYPFGTSILEQVFKVFKQKELLEDAILIYRIQRAPERRIFYIDVGNLPKVKAEQYLRDVMMRYRNKMVYDANTGEIRDDRKHMSMLEDFWLPRREGGRGTEITTLPGGQNLGELSDIEYFQKKLYRALGVPESRIANDGGFNLGRSSEILRDELKFSKFVGRLRKRFSNIFSDLLKTQLILKNIIAPEDWDTISDHIQYDYLYDNQFAELKETEMLNERLTILSTIEPFIGRYYSQDWVRRKVLRQTDTEMEEMDKQIEAEIKTGIIPDPNSVDPITGEPLEGGPQMLGDVPMEPEINGGITDAQVQKDTKSAEI